VEEKLVLTKYKQMKKKTLTLKNIVILGKFSDEKIRQVICNPEQQIAVISTIRSIQPDGTLHVIDEPMEAIEWDSEVDIHKTIKGK